MKRLLSFSLLVAVALLALAAFRAGTSDVTGTSSPSASERGVPEVMDAEFSEASIYQLGSSWTDRHGATLNLSDLRGRPRLVAMVFTRCGYACPRIVHYLKALRQALPEGQQSRVGMVLVSLDPEHDTPDALRAFGEIHGLQATQWTLLRGEAANVRELAAVLGVRYRQDAEGQFAHSNTITLLDAAGEIVFQQEGLGSDPSEMVRAIEAWTVPGSS